MPDLLAAAPLAVGVAVGTWWLLALPASYLVATFVLYAGFAWLLLAKVPADLPGRGLGPANRVTLARAALAVPLGSLAVVPWLPGAPVAPFQVGMAWMGPWEAWWVVALGTIVLVLDGVDGRVARRTGTATPFGARFDMELDAAVIMTLSLLVWTSGRAGAWCLLMGLMRYLFVAAGGVWPALRTDLPESFRRKVVCVVQGLVLLAALAPVVPSEAASAVVAGGLLLLTWSFAVDVRWATDYR